MSSSPVIHERYGDYSVIGPLEDPERAGEYGVWHHEIGEYWDSSTDPERARAMAKELAGIDEEFAAVA